jgi:ubiquinone/menaquinone biosynthesis C-methylase UbiE
MAISQEQFDLAKVDPKLANIVYHDWESESYDQKCVDYARNCFDHAVPRAIQGDDLAHARVIELGSGTGFFLLNLMQSGIGSAGIVTDLSSGMVSVAVRNGKNLNLNVTGLVADAEHLPFADSSVDLVVGHAVLHHVPDLDALFAEVNRVLRPGGRFVFCGEPTEKGDVVARALSRLTWWTSTRMTRLPMFHAKWALPADELKASSREAALESVVDIHTFNPDQLSRVALRNGCVDVSTVTEELTASWFGWPVRTFEASVKSDALGWGWANFAFGTWKRLESLDRNLLSKIVPDEYFYNVCITGVAP